MEGMKILILNGSPKGEMSVSMQYMRYLEKRFPHHRFETVNAAQACARYERNNDAFDELMERIISSDLVIWTFPLYFLLVCSQYKRFIELIFEKRGKNAFAGKYAAALSTSIHFFDNTAMNYIREVCGDLGMIFTGGVTAKMEDLTETDFRRNFDTVFTEWETAVRSGSPFPRETPAAEMTDYIYRGPQISEMTQNHPAASENQPRLCIVGDLEGEDSSIRNMSTAAAAAFRADGIQPEIIDLGSLRFGPCTGCLKCGFDNICAYEGKDDFIRLHREHILRADIILFAGKMHDRYLSSVWQRYLERTFNRTHQLTLEGKQIGFLISGPLSQNHNAREILKAYVEVNRGTLADFVTDESADNDRITAEIQALAGRMSSRAETKLRLPQSFLGIGGTKIFRDDIYSHLRFVFQADHKAYRRLKLYDFPQKQLGRRFMTGAAVLLTKIPPMRKVIRQQLRPGMLSPFRKVLDNVEPSSEHLLMP